MEQQWLPVVGDNGYEISDHGNTRSTAREITVISRKGNPFVRRYTGRLLAPCRAGAGGHLFVKLSYGQKHLVHHLVLEAFDQPRPAGLFGLHWDDDPLHNHISNLYWGTKSDNQHDKVRNGNHHNSNKTRCPQGHDYTAENTRIDNRGRRRCIACRRDQTLRWYHQHK